MRIMRGRWSVILFALLVAIAAGYLTRPFVLGLSFVVRAADLQGLVHSVAAIGTRGETERAIDIPTDTGSIRGRMYWPDREPRRVTLLVSGLHPAGIDEPRLVRLARQLAASGMAVITPDIPGLSTFEITPRLTDGIEATARWMTTMPAVTAGDGRSRDHGHQLQRWVVSRRSRSSRRFETKSPSSSLWADTTICRVCCDISAPGLNLTRDSRSAARTSRLSARRMTTASPSSYWASPTGWCRPVRSIGSRPSCMSFSSHRPLTA